MIGQNVIYNKKAYTVVGYIEWGTDNKPYPSAVKKVIITRGKRDDNGKRIDFIVDAHDIKVTK